MASKTRSTFVVLSRRGARDIPSIAVSSGAVTFCLTGNRVSWLGFQTNPSRLQSLPLVCDAKESVVLKDSFLSAASRKRTSLATISV